MEAESFDCLVLGNSLAMDGIDTELLTENGIPSYNLSIGGASLATNYVQLEKYLQKNNKPKLILLALSSSHQTNFQDTTLHPIITTVYGNSNYFQIKELPIIKFKWVASELLKKLISKEHRSIYRKYGQLKTTRKVADQSEFNNQSETTYNSNKYSKYFYLKEISSLCEDNGIDLLVLEMPGRKKYQNRIDSNNYLMNINNEYSINIVNLNNRFLCSTLIDSSNDWLGDDHLNIYGAKKLSTFILRNYLEKYSKN